MDLAKALPARFVHLGGKAFAAFRLVGQGFEVDLWDREDMSFEADLARRDVTVNALALDLHPATPGEGPVDLFGGLADLQNRVLRATTPDSFTDDPLRVLRLPRFVAELPGFQVEAGTLELARVSAPRVPGVAHERVREEIERVFGVTTRGVGTRFPQVIQCLRDTGLTAALVGEERAEETRFGTFEAVADRLRAAGEEVAPLAGRLALWTGGVGLDLLEERGHLTRETTRRARRVESGASWAAATEPNGCEAGDGSIEARRFLHDLGSLWPTAVAVAAARGWETWESGSRRLAAIARRHGPEIFDPPRFLSGHDVNRRFGVGPGPRVGEVLRALRQAQVDGTVTSQEEAEVFVNRWLEG